jgi:hypothetical protein
VLVLIEFLQQKYSYLYFISIDTNLVTILQQNNPLSAKEHAKEHGIKCDHQNVTQLLLY